jgi:hypothetical protein
MKYSAILILVSSFILIVSCSKRSMEDVTKKIDSTSKTLGRDVDTVVSKLDTAVKKVSGSDSLFDKVQVKDIDETKLNDKDFRKKLNDVFDEYVDIKEELEDNDTAGVNKEAKELKAALLRVQEGSASQPKEGKWKVWISGIERVAGEMETKRSLKEQRAAFRGLSSSIETMLKNNGLEGTTVYKISCPKSKEFWFTSTKDSGNPYVGRDKTTEQCAEVVEAWKFD